MVVFLFKVKCSIFGKPKVMSTTTAAIFFMNHDRIPTFFRRRSMPVSNIMNYILIYVTKIDFNTFGL